MDTKKDFGRIISAYDFFVEHSNEKEADANALISKINTWEKNSGVALGNARILDFGSGDGTFLAHTLRKLGRKVGEIVCIDPVGEYRQKAALALAPYSDKAIVIRESLGKADESPFDIIISNHVMYYVTALEATLGKLSGARKNGGLLLITMAAESNDLIAAWKTLFPKINMAVPYNLESDLISALKTRNLGYQRIAVSSTLNFANTDGNQMLIIQFLLGQHSSRLSNEERRRFFSSYSRGENIIMNIEDSIYKVD